MSSKGRSRAAPYKQRSRQKEFLYLAPPRYDHWPTRSFYALARDHSRERVG